MNRNLLLVTLAFQNGLLAESATVEAFQRCCDSPDSPIENWLIERQLLTSQNVSILVQLLEQRFGKLPELDIDSEEIHATVSTDAMGKVLAKLPAHYTQSLATIPWLTHFQSRAGFAKDQERSTPSSGVLDSKEQGRFRIVKKHAEGGLGVVFLAEDLQVARNVALKQIRQDRADEPFYRSKFQLEAEVTGQLEHPSIVPIYALGTDETGRPFYAMRFIKGESLRDHIQSYHVRLKTSEIVSDGSELRALIRRLIDVCDAIDYAHQRGVLHRDLKPGNIMLGKFGETLVVDWGLAKTNASRRGSSGPESADLLTETPSELVRVTGSADSSATEQGSFVGTLSYAPPEQLKGELELIGPASDIFSLGAILFEILTSRPPVSVRVEPTTAMQIIREIPQDPSLKGLPRSLRSLVAVCKKALEFQIGDRYSTIAALKEDLQNWLDDQPLEAMPDNRLMKLGRWLRQHRSLAGAMAVSLLVVTLSSLAVAFAMNQWANREQLAQQRESAARVEAETARVASDFANQKTIIDAASNARSLGQFKLAVEQMMKLEQLRPLEPHEILWLASDHLHSLNTTAVIPTLERLSLEKLSDSEKAVYKLILGDYFFMGKDDEKGQQLLSEALASEALDELQLLYVRGLLASTPLESAGYLDQVLDRDPLHSSARLRRGLTNLLLGRTSKVQKDVEFGLQVFQEDRRFRILSALLEAVAGDVKLARAIISDFPEDLLEYQSQIAVTQTLVELREFLNGQQNLLELNPVTFLSPSVNRLLTELQGATGPGIPSFGWAGSIYELLPSSPFEVFQILSSPEQLNKLTDKFEELAPDHAMARFVKFVFSAQSQSSGHADNYQLAKRAVEADPFFPEFQLTCLWYSIVDLGALTLFAEDRLEKRVSLYDLIVRSLEHRDNHGRFVTTMGAYEQFWELFVVNGFNEPALLLAQDELAVAENEEKQQFWQARIDALRELDARIVELSKQVINGLKNTDR